jgi:hypothetical protein
MTTGPTLRGLASRTMLHLGPVVGVLAVALALPGHRADNALRELFAAVVHGALALFPLLTLLWPAFIAASWPSATALLLGSLVQIWRCARSVRAAAAAAATSSV